MRAANRHELLLSPRAEEAEGFLFVLKGGRDNVAFRESIGSGGKKNGYVH